MAAGHAMLLRAGARRTGGTSIDLDLLQVTWACGAVEAWGGMPCEIV